MDYQGYKLIDKIMLVCRDIAEHEESTSIHAKRRDYQAYLVDPSNKKQLESARHWAKWTEYGPRIKNEETDRWEYKYIVEHAPVEFEFDNNGFELELLDCAGGSSQGGKLSFWNCLVTKENNRFIIGINSDMLLDLLKNATFINGKCQSPLIFITQKGKVGMTVEGSETYQQCLRDRDMKKELKSKATSKFSFGDRVKTATIDDVYLGAITQYYTFDPGINADRHTYFNYGLNYKACTITKLAKPIVHHIFEYAGKHWRSGKERTLSEIVQEYNSSVYACQGIQRSLPKRYIDGKITMDCTEEEFKELTLKAIYDYSLYKENYNKYNYEEEKLLYYFLNRDSFGFGFEPFELDEDLMNMIKTAGIKYVEES